MACFFRFIRVGVGQPLKKNLISLGGGKTEKTVFAIKAS